VVTSNRFGGLEYGSQKSYNGFTPYPSLPFSLEQLDISVEAFARILAGFMRGHIEGGATVRIERRTLV
jgi:hypothetical protein